MGSSTSISDKLSKILKNAISDKLFPGCCVGVCTPSEKYILPFGHQTYSTSSAKITNDSIFDIASVTKTIPTSLIALKCLEDNKFDLDTRIQTILPEFVGRWKDEVTVFHLLTQTVDFGLRLSQLKNLTPDGIWHAILECDLVVKPGTTYSYTNSTSVVLGKVVEKATGLTLSELAEKILFRPLLMNRTSFDTSRFDISQIVPTEFDPWRGEEVRGKVHDESAFVLSTKQYVGSAGLFSTVPDLLRVFEMIQHEGVFGGKRIFKKSTLESMMTNRLQHIGMWSGLGWEMNQQFVPDFFAKDSIGKTGFTGCLVFYYIPKKVGIVLLSNYHFPNRKKDFDSLNSIRQSILETVLS